MNEMKKTLTEGANWKFFSLLFCYPDERVVSAARTLAGELMPELRAEARFLVELMADPSARAAYHTLLGSSGSVSPYESAHQPAGREGMREKGVVLGDVAAFYRAFGFEHTKEVREAPDHLSVELAFLGYLKLKEVYALMNRDLDSYEICLDAEGKFLADHLLTWLPEFLDRIAEHAVHQFYRNAAQLLRTFLARTPRLTRS